MIEQVTYHRSGTKATKPTLAVTYGRRHFYNLEISPIIQPHFFLLIAYEP